jgi:hypothetical protein
MTARALLPTATPARTRAAALELLRGRRGRALATLGLLVAGTAVGLAGPALLGRIVDVVVDGGAVSDVDVLAAGRQPRARDRAAGDRTPRHGRSHRPGRG